MEKAPENVRENIKKVLESKVMVKVLYGIGIVLVALLIFSAGITVGFHKASYGRAWGEHYNENFGMGRRSNGFMMNQTGMMDYFPNAHGATGKIIKIELPNIIVQDNDKTEKVIKTDTNTIIQKGRVAITTAELKVDDFIVVIGAPNAQGQIEAKLIRVIPSPEFLTE